MADFTTSYVVAVTVQQLNELTKLREELSWLLTLGGKRGRKFTLDFDVNSAKLKKDFKKAFDDAAKESGLDQSGKPRQSDTILSLIRELRSLGTRVSGLNRTLRERPATGTPPAFNFPGGFVPFVADVTAETRQTKASGRPKKVKPALSKKEQTSYDDLQTQINDIVDVLNKVLADRKKGDTANLDNIRRLAKLVGGKIGKATLETLGGTGEVDSATARSRVIGGRAAGEQATQETIEAYEKVQARLQKMLEERLKQLRDSLKPLSQKIDAAAKTSTGTKPLGEQTVSPGQKAQPVVVPLQINISGIEKQIKAIGDAIAARIVAPLEKLSNIQIKIVTSAAGAAAAEVVSGEETLQRTAEAAAAGAVAGSGARKAAAKSVLEEQQGTRTEAELAAAARAKAEKRAKADEQKKLKRDRQQQKRTEARQKRLDESFKRDEALQTILNTTADALDQQADQLDYLATHRNRGSQETRIDKVAKMAQILTESGAAPMRFSPEVEKRYGLRRNETLTPVEYFEKVVRYKGTKDDPAPTITQKIKGLSEQFGVALKELARDLKIGADKVRKGTETFANVEELRARLAVKNAALVRGSLGFEPTLRGGIIATLKEAYLQDTARLGYERVGMDIRDTLPYTERRPGGREIYSGGVHAGLISTYQMSPEDYQARQDALAALRAGRKRASALGIDTARFGLGEGQYPFYSLLAGSEAKTKAMRERLYGSGKTAEDDKDRTVGGEIAALKNQIDDLNVRGAEALTSPTSDVRLREMLGVHRSPEQLKALREEIDKRQEYIKTLEKEKKRLDDMSAPLGDRNREIGFATRGGYQESVKILEERKALRKLIAGYNEAVRAGPGAAEEEYARIQGLDPVKREQAILALKVQQRQQEKAALEEALPLQEERQRTIGALTMAYARAAKIVPMHTSYKEAMSVITPQALREEDPDPKAQSPAYGMLRAAVQARRDDLALMVRQLRGRSKEELLGDMEATLRQGGVSGKALEDRMAGYGKLHKNDLIEFMLQRAKIAQQHYLEEELGLPTGRASTQTVRRKIGEQEVTKGRGKRKRKKTENIYGEFEEIAYDAEFPTALLAGVAVAKGARPSAGRHRRSVGSVEKMLKSRDRSIQDLLELEKEYGDIFAEGSGIFAIPLKMLKQLRNKLVSKGGLARMLEELAAASPKERERLLGRAERRIASDPFAQLYGLDRLNLADNEAVKKKAADLRSIGSDIGLDVMAAEIAGAEAKVGRKRKPKVSERLPSPEEARRMVDFLLGTRSLIERKMRGSKEEGGVEADLSRPVRAYSDPYQISRVELGAALETLGISREEFQRAATADSGLQERLAGLKKRLAGLLGAGGRAKPGKAAERREVEQDIANVEAAMKDLKERLSKDTQIHRLPQTILELLRQAIASRIGTYYAEGELPLGDTGVPNDILQTKWGPEVGAILGRGRSQKRLSKNETKRGKAIFEEAFGRAMTEAEQGAFLDAEAARAQPQGFVGPPDLRAAMAAIAGGGAGGGGGGGRGPTTGGTGDGSFGDWRGLEQAVKNLQGTDLSKLADAFVRMADAAQRLKANLVAIGQSKVGELMLKGAGQIAVSQAVTEEQAKRAAQKKTGAAVGGLTAEEQEIVRNTALQMAGRYQAASELQDEFNIHSFMAELQVRKRDYENARKAARRTGDALFQTQQRGIADPAREKRLQKDIVAKDERVVSERNRLEAMIQLARQNSPQLYSALAEPYERLERLRSYQARVEAVAARRALGSPSVNLPDKTDRAADPAKAEAITRRTIALQQQLAVGEDTVAKALRRRMQAMIDQYKVMRSHVSLMERFVFALRRLAYYTGAAFLIYSLVASIRTAVREVFQLEEAFARIQGILQSKALGERLQIETGVTDAAQEFGENILAAAKTSQIFAQTGLSATETVRATRAALAGQVGAGLEAGQVQELLIAVKNISDGSIQFGDILDRISRVESQRAVTAQDLSLAIQRIGALGKQLQPEAIGGIDFADVIAGATTKVVETTRITGTAAATGLKFILSRLAAPDIASRLQEQFGIDLATKGTGGRELRPLQDILYDVGKLFQALTESGRTVEAAQLLQTVAGARRINIAAALFSDFDEVLEVARLSSRAFGDTNQRVEIQMDTLARTVQRVHNALIGFSKALLEDTGLAAALKVVVGSVGELLNAGARNKIPGGPAGSLALLSGIGALGFGGIGRLGSLLISRGEEMSSIQGAATRASGLSLVSPMGEPFTGVGYREAAGRGGRLAGAATRNVGAALGAVGRVGPFLGVTAVFSLIGVLTELVTEQRRRNRIDEEKFGAGQFDFSQIRTSDVAVRLGSLAGRVGLDTRTLSDIAVQSALQAKQAILKEQPFKDIGPALFDGLAESAKTHEDLYKAFAERFRQIMADKLGVAFTELGDKADQTAYSMEALSITTKLLVQPRRYITERFQRQTDDFLTEAQARMAELTAGDLNLTRLTARARVGSGTSIEGFEAGALGRFPGAHQIEMLSEEEKMRVRLQATSDILGELTGGLLQFKVTMEDVREAMSGISSPGSFYARVQARMAEGESPLDAYYNVLKTTRPAGPQMDTLATGGIFPQMPFGGPGAAAALQAVPTDEQLRNELLVIARNAIAQKFDLSTRLSNAQVAELGIRSSLLGPKLGDEEKLAEVQGILTSIVQQARDDIAKFLGKDSGLIAELDNVALSLQNRWNRGSERSEIITRRIFKAIKDRLLEVLLAYNEQMGKIRSQADLFGRAGVEFDRARAEFSALQQAVQELGAIVPRFEKDQLQKAVELSQLPTGIGLQGIFEAEIEGALAPVLQQMIDRIPTTAGTEQTAERRRALELEVEVLEGVLKNLTEGLPTGLLDALPAELRERIGKIFEVYQFTQDNELTLEQRAGLLAGTALTLPNLANYFADALGDAQLPILQQERARTLAQISQQNRQRFLSAAFGGERLVVQQGLAGVDAQFGGRRRGFLNQQNALKAAQDRALAASELEGQKALLYLNAVYTNTLGQQVYLDKVEAAELNYLQRRQSINDEEALAWLETLYGEITEKNKRIFDTATGDLRSALSGVEQIFRNPSELWRSESLSRVFEPVAETFGNRLTSIFMEATTGKNGLFGESMSKLFQPFAQLEAAMIYDAHVRGITAGFIAAEIIRAGGDPKQAVEGVKAYMKAEGLATTDAELSAEMRARAKEAALISGATIAGTLAGAGIGELLGGNNKSGKYSQLFGGLGSSIALMAGASTPLTAGIGFGAAVLGGLFGALLGDEPKKSLTVLDAVARNTGDTVTAIENQTAEMRNLEQRLLNVPATFAVPALRPFGAAGGVGQSVVQNVNIVIQDARDPDATASAVARVLKQQTRYEGSFITLRGD